MVCISATNPPVHKIGNSFESIFPFHVTRKPVNFNERLDCIWKMRLQMRKQRACKEEKKSDKPKTEAGAGNRGWSHCE